jgi:pimeloyl-ACP methyl ester carboxylesterase
MATFVLVHGAWHGGWCYRDTAAALRAAGHTVFTPTHTGLGERAHQAGENVTLETHVRDVCGCIESEELTDVILCGHSYGGMVITSVADRMPERIKALAYLDAYVPEHGESMIDQYRKTLTPEQAAETTARVRSAARTNSDGMMLPRPAEAFNVAPARRAWVDRRCVPQALATFEMPVLLTGAGAQVTQRVYILADNWDPSPFRWFAARLEATPGWRVVRFPCGHDVMVDMPVELAQELMRLA